MTYKHIKFKESFVMKSFEKVAWQKGLLNNKFSNLTKIIKSADTPATATPATATPATATPATATPAATKLTKAQLDAAVRKVKSYLYNKWASWTVCKKLSKTTGLPAWEVQKRIKVLVAAFSFGSKTPSIELVDINNQSILDKYPIFKNKSTLGVFSSNDLKILINDSIPEMQLESVLSHEFHHFIDKVLELKFGAEVVAKINQERLDGFTAQDFAQKASQSGQSSQQAYQQGYVESTQENYARLGELRYLLKLGEYPTEAQFHKALSNVVQNYNRGNIRIEEKFSQEQIDSAIKSGIYDVNYFTNDDGTKGGVVSIDNSKLDSDFKSIMSKNITKQIRNISNPYTLATFICNNIEYIYCTFKDENRSDNFVNLVINTDKIIVAFNELAENQKGDKSQQIQSAMASKARDYIEKRSSKDYKKIVNFIKKASL